MPEDQGQIGDRWTEEASELFKRLGWEKVADSNIDIEGTDGHQHGIDALFKYADGLQNNIQEGIFLEAKSYSTDSFRVTKFADWVNKLDLKIRELRRSEEFNTMYPAMAETNPRNGLLVIWFRDVDNYSNFKPRLDEAFTSIRTPRGYSRVKNRLFIVSNDDILRLSSLVDAIKDWNNENSELTNLKFVYPSSLEFKYATQETTILNFEYACSKFVISKAQKISHLGIKNFYSIFYFGHLDIQSFERLRSALLRFNIPETPSNLFLYHYQRDDNFRKIEPDVKNLFNSIGEIEVEIKAMDRFSDLPSWMKNSRRNR